MAVNSFTRAKSTFLFLKVFKNICTKVHQNGSQKLNLIFENVYFRVGSCKIMQKEFLYLSVASYNQLQKYLRHCTVFWLKWPVHDLVLVTPPPPLFKVASNTRPCSKLGGTTLNGGRRGVSILSHRPVTSSDLKQDRLFFRESVSTFLQLVVAQACD